MPRLLLPCLAIISATVSLATQATAGPRFLPRLHLPNINVGKAVKAVAYPVTKSVVNGGKTALKTAGTAEAMGAFPNLGPRGSNGIVKKVIGDVTRH